MSSHRCNRIARIRRALAPWGTALLIGASCDQPERAAAARRPAGSPSWAGMPGDSRAVALVGVHVVDVVTGAVRRDQTVLIEGGRITKVEATRSVSVPASAERQDVAGGYVIPGLWDMHVHLSSTGRTALPLFLANGVTGVRDMGSRRATIGAWMDSVNAGTLAGPHIVGAGTILESTGWLDAVRRIAHEESDSALSTDLATRVPFDSPESATGAVDSVAALGADFLKIRNDPAPGALFALLRAARARGLAVTGHWPVRVSPEVASDSGFRSFEHGPLASRDGSLVPTWDTLSPVQRRALYQRFARNGTAYTPTTVTMRGYRLLPDSAVLRQLAGGDSAIDPRMRFMDQALVRRWRSAIALKAREGSSLPWGRFQVSWLRELRPMADAGVMLLAGTDAGVPLVHTGFALSDELEALVKEGGLTPLQSLQTATINPARWLGTEARQGAVLAGRDADLVVLERNPLEDIANVRRIRAVLRAGRVFDRFAVDSLLESVERAVREAR